MLDKATILAAISVTTALAALSGGIVLKHYNCAQLHNFRNGVIDSVKLIQRTKNAGRVVMSFASLMMLINVSTYFV